LARFTILVIFFIVTFCEFDLFYGTRWLDIAIQLILRNSLRKICCNEWEEEKIQNESKKTFHISWENVRIEYYLIDGSSIYTLQSIIYYGTEISLKICVCNKYFEVVILYGVIIS